MRITDQNLINSHHDRTSREEDDNRVVLVQLVLARDIGVVVHFNLDEVDLGHRGCRR